MRPRPSTCDKCGREADVVFVRCAAIAGYFCDVCRSGIIAMLCGVVKS